MTTQPFFWRKLFIRVRTTESYSSLLLAILLLIGLTTIGAEHFWSRLLILLSASGTFLLTMAIAQIPRRSLFLLFICVLIVVILAGVGDALSNHLDWLSQTLGLLLLIGTVIATLHRLRLDNIISLQTIMGAICIYLLIGLVFANLYNTLGLFASPPVFVGIAHAALHDYLYFSFITLTTVGYGDLAPLNGIARALAVTEALSGQIYLVTVIALLVGHFGKERIP